jgi:hypothetical protein
LTANTAAADFTTGGRSQEQQQESKNSLRKKKQKNPFFSLTYLLINTKISHFLPSSVDTDVRGNRFSWREIGNVRVS